MSKVHDDLKLHVSPKKQLTIRDFNENFSYVNYESITGCLDAATGAQQEPGSLQTAETKSTGLALESD